MALLKFLKGNYSNLSNASITEGQILICGDTGEMFVDVAADKRVKIGDFITVANLTALEALDATKVPTSRLYYVEDGNILARSNGTSWVQVNKQKTAAELKEFLGLGSLAYLSQVAEANLSTELAAKVNASAEGNHSHANKTVLDGITAEKVTAWDAAEGNAKSHANDLNTAMNARVEALEAIDHEHTNKELLDTYTQTEVNLADAVAKKHSHANAAELDKIVEGDKAKWDAVAADHLTSADKTTLENSIKEAKKAGTDANTALETYKVANDARVKAVEDDIAEITAAEGGILAQAKSYSDGKLATARTEVTAEIDADVKVVNDALEAYKTSNDTAVAGVKATAEAAATKAYTDEELAKKVDKVTGKSLVDDAEITKLTGVSAGANKVEASANNGSIKIDGVETVVYTHPEKHAISDVTGLQEALNGMQAAGDYAAEKHTHTKSEITDFEHTHTVSEITDFDEKVKAYDYATKAEAQDYADAKDDAIAAAKTAADNAQAAADKAQGEVDALETYVGTIPETATATNIVAYVQEKTAGIATNTALEELTGRVADLETDSATHAIKTEVESALALKADKSVVDAMYTNTQIDELVQGAKDYADANDADTKYGIAYDSENKKIKLVEGGSEVEIDASAFIKDGMINTVTIDENDDLIITFNTDAGKENIVLPLDQLVDIYTGVEGARIKVTVGADKSISADLVAGSISKDYLDESVKASLALADSAIQAHQDISHLATTEALNGVDAKFANYTTTTDLNAALELKADKTQVATDIAAAKQDASNKDAVILAEAQAYADQAEADAIAAAEGKVNALAGNVYTKEQTYTQAEVDALLIAAQSWGEF